jgi:seryl-tRNA synthetase
MSTYHIELIRPVPLSLRDELARRVYYVAPGIDSFVLVTGGESVTGVEITTVGEADCAALTRKLNHVTQTEILPQRVVDAEPVWRSPHAGPQARGVFERLKGRGAVIEMGPGCIATGPPFTDLVDALDRCVRDIATTRFGAAEYRYPTLISTQALLRGGYLRSFPQFIMAAGHLHTDVDTYQQFVAGLDTEEPGRLFDRFAGHTGYCLPPTMCYHTYLQLSGSRLATVPTVITSRGKSFRFESRYSRSVERLWDFTIREVVFLGDAETTARRRDDFLAAGCTLVEDLGLAGHVELANDPFFAGVSAAHRVLAQRMRKLKYELRLPVEDGRDVAVASFNVHGTTFGDPYGITVPGGGPAHTACVGFGLERLAFAFFCRHGTEPRRWPSSVRARLGW